MLSSKYAGIRDCLYLTFKNEGLRGFYQGIGASLVSVSFYSGKYMVIPNCFFIEGFELNDIKYKSLLYRYKIYITI
jgi:hypothetical protein